MGCTIIKGTRAQSVRLQRTYVQYDLDMSVIKNVVVPWTRK